MIISHQVGNTGSDEPLVLMSFYFWFISFQIISKCVNTCLLQASKFKSIVFPGMGTGNLHYPRDLVAEVMYQCVQKFDHTNSSLKEIKFLCFDHDTIQVIVINMCIDSLQVVVVILCVNSWHYTSPFYRYHIQFVY